MRICFAVLIFLTTLAANSSFAQLDKLHSLLSHEDPTVLNGEFEYAVSSLGKPALEGLKTLTMISTFIGERQPLQPKHVQLLEEHRQDLVHLMQSQSLKSEAALILMWMNMQAGMVDNELAKQFDGIEQGRFVWLHFLAMPMNVQHYETFQQVIAARRLRGHNDPNLPDRGEVAEILNRHHDLFFPEPMLKLRERENWLRENLSPEARVDFKAALDVILDDAQTLQVRKSKTAIILWELIDFPELEQERFDMLAGARDQLVDLFKHTQADSEFKGMLASLLVCTNHRADAQCAVCQEAMKSLNPMELNLVMQYAPMLRMQSGKQFQQIIVDQFMNCDEDTAQMIIDVLEMYADANDLDFATVIALVAKLKERPQISTSHLKQMLTMLVDINARETGKLGWLEEFQESVQERKADAKKIEELELESKELELEIKELEKQMLEHKRFRRPVPR